MLLPAALLWACGWQSVAWSAEATDARAPESEAEDQSALEVSEELQRRLSGIEELQADLGQYDPALIEAYSDLADFYTEHGDHAQALEMNRDAMQLARINLGLNSEQQLPFIEDMIDANEAMKDWRGADDLHHLQFYLRDRLYDPGELRYAEAVEAFGDWKLRVITENLMGQSYRVLSREADELSRIYRNGIVRIQASPDYREANLLPLFEGKSRVDMEYARYLADTPYQYFQGTVDEYIYEQICSNVRAQNGQIVRSCTTVQRVNPRYRDSQRDAKRIEVDRALREVEYSLRQMETILANNLDIDGAEREHLESEMRRMEVEYDQIARIARRRSLF